MIESGRPRWNRERIKAFLEHRYSTRLHMGAILAASGLAAMVTSWSLLHGGVHSMLVRYPIAITISYVTFLLGVWVWLRVMGLRAGTGIGRTVAENADLPDISVSGGGGGGGGSGGGLGLPRGGGTFDGGGASTSWGPRVNAPSMRMSSKGSSSGSGFGIDLDGDAIVLLVLAALLVLVVFATSGYLIWIAPDVLTEAAFGAMLAGGLSRPTARQSETGWISGVVRKTCWPFAVVLVAALAFAGWVAIHYPAASTFKQAIAIALSS